MGTDICLAYCTNIWSHHQAPLCMEFVRLLGGDQFKLCLFEQVPDEQRRLGYADCVPCHDWIVGPPTSNGELQRLSQVICEADVAVLGAVPQEIVRARAATGKLTFIMSERMSKKPFHWWRMLNPRFARGINEYRSIVNHGNVHYLAMGAYAAGDVRRLEIFGDRLWSWAYFADVAPHPPRSRTGSRIRILWAGRMLDWKRVDMLLKAVAHVCPESNFGGLDLVGAGPEKARLQKLAKKLNLGDKCKFHEPVPAEQVRKWMREADFYVLASNRCEGWGVVANEAMSEGAILVANEQAGAARTLVDHGRTGFLFQDNNPADLADILRRLMVNAPLQDKIRQSAWQEIQALWHPRVGAERLIGLSKGLLGLAIMPEYQEGPCCSCSLG